MRRSCVITGSYRRKGKVLAIFGNLSGETVKFDLKLDRRKLGLFGDSKPKDAETGTPLVGGKVEIAPYDVRLVVACPEARLRAFAVPSI